MSFLDQILAAEWITRLGWTLLHSLWQIVLVTAATALLLSLMRRGTANARYLVACGGLTVMAFVPVVTFFALPDFQTPDIVASVTDEDVTSIDIAAVAVEGITVAENAMEETGPVVSEMPGEESLSPVTFVASAVPEPTAEIPATAEPQESSRQRITAAISPWMPWCVIAWFAGVFVVSVWNLGGWIAAQRLKRLGTNPVGKEISRRLSDLAKRSGIRRSVTMVKSLLVEVPVVVGWLRPIILLPASALTGLTPTELDAVLAHELAHIRRHDYLVNLLQTVIETLLFYHPGVWWISRQVRAEREHCCDDVAVALCGNKIDYASALAAVEAGRAAPKMVMAARKADGSTLGRIRRILGLAGTAPRRWGRSLAGGLVTSAMILALVMCFVVAGEGTEEDASAAESEQADWSAAAAKVFPDWKTAESGRYEKADVGTAKASRLVLAKERRIYVGFPFASANAKYPRDKGTGDPNYRSIFSHIDIITFDEQADLPKDICRKLAWTEWEDTDGLFVKTVDLGTGLGRRWIVRTTLVWQHQLRTELKIAGGDDPIQLLVEGLLVEDAGLNAHDTIVLDTRRTARNVVNPLAAYGDKAVTYIERQIAKPNEPTDLAYLLRPLAVMHTEAADNLLKVLYEDPITQALAGDTLIGGEPRKGLKAIYLDMLEKRRRVSSVGEVCVMFNWREAEAILRDFPATPNNWWSELEPSLTLLHKLGGKPREEIKVVCLDLLKKRQHIGSVDKVCATFNWREATPILRDIHATARNWSELESSYTALRKLEGHPIPEQLTRVREDLSPYNLAEAVDPIVEKAGDIILNSPDRQAAAIIATRLAYLRGVKASREMIDASNRIGKELLAKMGDDAKPVLKIIIANFSDETIRKDCQKTLDFISGKIPSDDSSDELPIGVPAAGDPFEVPGTGDPSAAASDAGNEGVAWGKLVDGLQLGLAFDLGDRPYQAGERVSFKLQVRNTSKKPISISYFLPMYPGALTIKDTQGKQFSIVGPPWNRPVQLLQKTLAPGAILDLTDISCLLKESPEETNSKTFSVYLSKGKYRVSIPCRFNDRSATGKNWSGELTTGELELEVKESDAKKIPRDASDELAVESLKKLGWMTNERGSLRRDSRGRVSRIILNIKLLAPNRDVPVTDAWLVHLKGLTALQWLNLQETHITDAGLVHLKGLTNLTRLSLNETHITDAGLANLKGLTNLKDLNLGYTQVTDAGLAHLRGLTNLEDLQLSGSQVTDAGLVHLKGLTNLRQFRLWDTQITDVGLVHLKGLTNLETLSLGETQVTDEGVRDLQQALPNCNIAPPVAKPATETPSAAAKAVGEEEITWGKPSIDRVQVRLRADKHVWRNGENPTFEVDMRNKGVRGLNTSLIASLAVEVDGEVFAPRAWFQLGTIGVSPFGPGAEYTIGISLSAFVSTDKRAQDLAPGKHTVRVVLLNNLGESGIYTSLDKYKEMTLAFSNAVEITIEPSLPGARWSIEKAIQEEGAFAAVCEAVAKSTLTTTPSPWIDPYDTLTQEFKVVEVLFGKAEAVDRIDLVYKVYGKERDIQHHERVIWIGHTRNMSFHGGLYGLNALPDTPENRQAVKAAAGSKAAGGNVIERKWSDATIDFTLRVTAGTAETPCVAEIVITNKTDETQSVPAPFVMPLCGDTNKNNIRVSDKDGNPLEMRGLHADGPSRASTELAGKASKTWRFELERYFADMADPGTYQVEPWYFSDHTKWSSWVGRVKMQPLTVVRKESLLPAWSKPVEGVSVRLTRAIAHRQPADLSLARLLLEYDARNGGERILHLPNNGLRHQIEVDGVWYDWVDPRIGLPDSDELPNSRFTKLLDFEPDRRHRDQRMNVADNWRAIPKGKEKEYAARQYWGWNPMNVQDDYGKELVLTPGKHRVRVAVACPSARAANRGVIRAVSEVVEVEVPPSPDAKNEDTAKIELKLGSDKTKTISVALGQNAVDIHNLCKPAKVYADDDPWLAAMAAGGGSYVFFFAAEGTPEEMRGRLDARRDKLYAVLRYPTDSKDNGKFLLPSTMRNKTYGDFVTMKVPLGPKKAKAATVALGMSTDEVKHLFSSATDRANEEHAVVFDSVHDDNKYLLLFTPEGDDKIHNPKLDKLSEVIYRHGDKPEAIYLLPRSKRGKPVAAEHRKLLGIVGGTSGTGTSNSADKSSDATPYDSTESELVKEVTGKNTERMVRENIAKGRPRIARPMDSDARQRFLEIERIARLPMEQQAEELPRLYMDLAPRYMNEFVEGLISSVRSHILDDSNFDGPGGTTTHWAEQLADAASEMTPEQVADKLGHGLWVNTASRARAIQVFKKHADTTAALIRADLKAKNREPVQRAAQTIQSVGLLGFTDALLEALLRNDETSEPALRALTFTRGASVMQRLLEEVKKDPKSLIRFAGLFQGPQWREPADPLLLDLLDSPDAEIRYAAIRAVYECTDPKLAPVAVRLAADKDQRFRVGAAKFTGNLPRTSFLAVREKLLPLIADEDEGVRNVALRAFAQQKDLAAAEMILKLLKQDEVGEGLKVTIMQSMTKLAGSHFHYFMHEWGPDRHSNQKAIDQFEAWLKDARTNQKEPAWGDAVEGIQFHIRAEKPMWPQGTVPKLFADLRNLGKQDRKIAIELESWEFEIDGKRHPIDFGIDGARRYWSLGPGMERHGLKVEVLPDGSLSRKLRALKPGKHTIRVARLFHERSFEERLRVVSNPIEIEIAANLLDGVYRIRGLGSTEQGVEVARSDADGTVVLLHRLTDNFGTAAMASIANDNSRFRINLNAAGPFSEGDDVGHFALWIDGLCVMVEAHSNLDKDRRMNLTAWVGGKEVPARIAAGLGIKPSLRKHPGHKMAVRFSPTKRAFGAGESVVLNMEIKNVGDGSFSFGDGGRQRGARNNQFGFTAFRRGGDGPEVPDTGDPINWGGLGTFITLKPGEVFQKQIDIAKWFDLAKPDTYKINCRFEMEISDDWDDVAQGTAMVVVADAAWGKPVKGMRAALLAEKPVPGGDTMPAFLLRLENDRSVMPGFSEGLQNFALELDGLRYRLEIIDNLKLGDLPIGFNENTGKEEVYQFRFQQQDGSLTVNRYWQAGSYIVSRESYRLVPVDPETEKPLAGRQAKLMPGKHGIRVGVPIITAIRRYPAYALDQKGAPQRAWSNAVAIDVLPKELKTKAAVSGKVLGADGKPLAGVPLAVECLDKQRKWAEGRKIKSDEQGGFKIGDLSPGEVFICYEKSSEDVSERAGDARMFISHVKVEEGEVVENALVDLSKATCVLEGQLVDHQGNGIAGASVQALYVPSWVAHTVWTETDEHGRYRIAGLPPHEFRVFAHTKDHYGGPGKQVKLKSGKTETIDMLAYVAGRSAPEPKPDDPRWGKPKGDLRAVIELRPSQETYAIGEIVEMKPILRNTGEKTVTLIHDFALAAELQVTDEAGKMRTFSYKTFSGDTVSTTYVLEPGHEVEMQGSVRLKLVGADSREDLIQAPGMLAFALKCRPGAKYSLSYDLGEGLRTGEAHLVVKDPIVAENTNTAEPDTAGEKDSAKPAAVPSKTTVRGEVVDDATGEPVTDFFTEGGKFDPADPAKVVWGYSETRSSRKSGKFSATVRWPEGWTSRIVAPGYLPQPVLTQPPLPGQDAIEVVVRLKRGAAIRGRVLDHTGKPVAKAGVYLAGRGVIRLAEGPWDELQGPSVRTDAEGRFEIGGRGEDSKAIFVTAPSLYVWRADLPEPGQEATIRLPEPAKLHIRYDIEGGPPAAQVRIELRTWDMPKWRALVDVGRWVDVKPGEEGLVIDNLPPGVYDISRIKHTKAGNSGKDMMLDRELKLTLASGKTTAYDFVRKAGTLITGEVVGLPKEGVSGVFVYVRDQRASGDPRNEDDWKLRTFDGLALEGNGPFKTERLPPGKHKVVVEAYKQETPKEMSRSGLRLPKWTGTADVDVPESGEPPKVRVTMHSRDAHQMRGRLGLYPAVAM